MNSWTIFKVTAMVGLASEVIYYAYKKKFIRKLANVFRLAWWSSLDHLQVIQQLQQEYFYKVLFFPDEKYPCLFYSWKGGCDAANCPYAHTETNFKILGDYLYSAKQSLDVCVYTISSSVLCNIILDVHETGVLVRIIVDDESDNFTGSMIQKLRENGIQLRTDKSSFLMHHKFVIIDQEVLINGSFNWTRSAITANNENVLITNQPNLVKPYKGEFDKLWKTFAPKSGLSIKRSSHHSDRQ